MKGLRQSSDPSVLILTSLAGGPKHGHAPAKDIQEFAGVTLGPGTLYGAITRLEEQGLIAPRDRGSSEAVPDHQGWIRVPCSGAARHAPHR